jgi:hypothetical protein
VDSILRHLTTQRVPLLSKRKRSTLGISKKNQKTNLIKKTKKKLTEKIEPVNKTD